VKLSPDLVGKVAEGDVVLVKNSAGDETYEVLLLQIEERPDVWNGRGKADHLLIRAATRRDWRDGLSSYIT
jgi:hypothetical protein